MEAKKPYALHTVCAAALFTLGSAVITVPKKGADNLTFLGFIVAAIAAVALSFLAAPVAARLFAKTAFSGGKIKKTAVGTLWIATALLCVGVSAHSFGVLCDFVGGVILPDGSRLLVAVILFAAAAMPCVGHKSVVLKFALFSAIITAVAVLLFIAAALPELRVENIILLRVPEIGSVLRQSVPYLVDVFLPAYIIYVYVGVHFGRENGRTALLGVAAGGVVLGIILLNSLLLFGAPLAARLEYPYASAISTVTLGELFTRMDGFSYFIYFAACIVRLAVCVSVVKTLLCRLGEKRERAVGCFALALSAALGMIL